MSSRASQQSGNANTGGVVADLDCASDGTRAAQAGQATVSINRPDLSVLSWLSVTVGESAMVAVTVVLLIWSRTNG